MKQFIFTYLIWLFDLMDSFAFIMVLKQKV